MRSKIEKGAAMSEKSSRTLDEQALALRIEDLTGGRVTAMERQPRHRPAWFVDVDCGGEHLGIYARGERGSDVQPFPELRREADILQILEAHGIPVPHVYGMCEAPETIIMQSLKGSRDVSEAGSDETRREIARRYIEILAQMHAIPVEPFVEQGLTRPVGAVEVGLAGLEAYLPLYLRRKVRPEPLIEFAMSWLRRNVPANREQASFVAFDAGQFLFSEDRLEAIYDLEYALIGDPMADLATMALREPIEPMGDDIGSLCRYYAELTGESLDVPAIRFHQVVFSVVAMMQFAGALADPAPGDPHDVYLSWWIYMRRCLILTLSKCIGLEKVEVEMPEPRSKALTPLTTLLEDSIRAQPTSDAHQKAARRASLGLVTFLAEFERFSPEVDRIACEEAAPLLGECCSERAELEMRLESFVATATPADDERLLRLFARDDERQRIAYRASPTGQSADFARLVEI
jgi:aminoglycoside phosphotransferase (APT) family kinase protein